MVSVPLRTAWDTFAADAIVHNGPCLLHGIVVLASAAGGDVTLYEGLDATSGHKVGTFKGGANLSNPVMLPAPRYCARGVYLDVGSNITEVQVGYTPIDESA